MVASPARLNRVLLNPALRRVAASAFVAGGLGFVFWLVVYIGARSHFAARLNCGESPWGCLYLGIIGVAAGLLVIVLLAWPLLRLAGVRPAWPVALLGPLIAINSYRAFLLADRSLISGLWIFLAISYAAAAVITAPRFFRYWSAAVAMTVVALDIATRFIGFQ